MREIVEPTASSRRSMPIAFASSDWTNRELKQLVADLGLDMARQVDLVINMPSGILECVLADNS